QKTKELNPGRVKHKQTGSKERKEARNKPSRHAGEVKKGENEETKGLAHQAGRQVARAATSCPYYDLNNPASGNFFTWMYPLGSPATKDFTIRRLGDVLGNDG